MGSLYYIVVGFVKIVEQPDLGSLQELATNDLRMPSDSNNRLMKSSENIVLKTTSGDQSALTMR